MRRTWRAWCVVLVAAACDAGEPPELIILGGVDVRDVDRGSYASSDPAVVALATRDHAEEVCPCICPLGCPGKEVTALRTELRITAAAEGRATVRGRSIYDQELAIEIAVERGRALEVREVTSGDNDGRGTVIPDDRTLAIAAGGRAILHIDVVGASNLALAGVNGRALTVEPPDRAVAVVSSSSPSTRGWRVILTATGAGESTVRLVTPWATRDVPIRVTR